MAKVLACISLAVAAVAWVGSAPADGRGRCPSIRHPLGKSKQAVLYVYAPDVVGCWRATGRRRVIVKGDGNFRPDDVSYARVAGRYAALAEIYHGPVGDGRLVWIADIKTGRGHNADANYHSDVIVSGAAAARIDALVLTSTGSAAWTTDAGPADFAYEPPFPPPPPFHVQAMDRHGKTWTVDGESGIDPHSLRRHGQTISWTASGVRKTARLP